MEVAGRLEIKVAGERWRPVASLDRCGPDDPCYIVRLDDEGTATVVFGDGTMGRRPSAGARVQALYERGAGVVGRAGTQAQSDLRALLEILAEMVDIIQSDLKQMYADAYIETATGHTSLMDAAHLRRTIAEGHGEINVCLRLRPESHRHHRHDV